MFNEKWEIGQKVIVRSNGRRYQGRIVDIEPHYEKIGVNWMEGFDRFRKWFDECDLLKMQESEDYQVQRCDMLDLINLCLKHNVEISIRPTMEFTKAAKITVYSGDHSIKDVNLFDTTSYGITRFDLNNMIFDYMRKSVRRVEIERDRRCKEE